MNERLERITEERNNCLGSIQEYRQEIAKLTDPNFREEGLSGLGDAMGKMNEYISSAEDQRTKQMRMMNDLIHMLDMGTKRNPKVFNGSQTDLSLVPGEG